MIQLHSIKIEKTDYKRRKYAMRATHHDCQILSHVFINSILYVSYFLTDSRNSTHAISAGIEGRPLLMA